MKAIAVVWEEGGLFYLPEGDGAAPITVFDDGRVYDRVLRDAGHSPWRDDYVDRVDEIRGYAEDGGYASKCPVRKNLGLPPHGTTELRVSPVEYI